MLLATVIGTVVSTRKEDSLVGFKLLIVETLTPGKPGQPGNRFVAIDTLGAGEGDEVLIATGGSARAHLNTTAPIDACVIGIVDSTDVAS